MTRHRVIISLERIGVRTFNHFDARSIAHPNQIVVDVVVMVVSVVLAVVVVVVVGAAGVVAAVTVTDVVVAVVADLDVVAAAEFSAAVKGHRLESFSWPRDRPEALGVAHASNGVAWV